MVVVNIFAIILLALSQIMNMWVLLGLRFLAGLAAGSLLSMTPIYINELCPK